MTIRSSVRNRAKSMQEVIDKLTEIKKELAKENYVINSEINSNNVFIGMFDNKKVSQKYP